MPSAYQLVLDKIAQSRAITSSEVWRDGELLLLFDLIEERLLELEHGVQGKKPSKNVVSLIPYPRKHHSSAR